MLGSVLSSSQGPANLPVLIWARSLASALEVALSCVNYSRQRLTHSTFSQRGFLSFLPFGCDWTRILVPSLEHGGGWQPSQLPFADPLKVTGKDVRWHSLRSRRSHGLISIRVHRACLRELVIGPFESHAIPEQITMGKGWSSVIGQFGSCAHLIGTTWHRGSSEDCQGLVPARAGSSCWAGQTSRCGVHLLPSKLSHTFIGRKTNGDRRLRKTESRLGPLIPL